MAKRLPDEHEAIEGAKVAAATAEGLLRDSDILAAAGSYGTAVSLAVLGFEEAVKARMLGAITVAASMGHCPGFSEGDLRKIVYSGHRERHAAGFYQHIAAAYPDVYGKMMLGMSLGAPDAAMLQELIEFLNTANVAKQGGFYSDFDPASGTWSSLGNTAEADYAKVRTLIANYIAETRRQVGEFERERPRNGLAAEIRTGEIPPSR